MKQQNLLGEEVLNKNWQTLFVVGVISFLVILAIDFAADDEGVTPREGLPPAVVDMERRLHRARVGWCAAWADKGRVQECKDVSLLAFKEAVEEPLEIDE